MRFCTKTIAADGEKKQIAAKTDIFGDGITVVSADARCDKPLDARCAVLTEIECASFDAATALERHSEYWCRPAFCASPADVPDETQLLLMKNGEKITVILPVVSDAYRTVLCGSGEAITAKTFSLCDGLTECSAPIMVVGEGGDAFSLLEKCFAAALKATASPALPRKSRVYPEILEYLGWCSWDAMQIRVNRDGLVEKCREFARKNIPVQWALIDDMWADVPAFKGAVYSCRDEMISLMHGSALASFNADPDRFPGGLKAAVDEMKHYVRCVGAWHPLTGYWFGIDENGELYERFKDILYRAPDGRIIIKPDYPSLRRFFGAFHKYLAECGVDFVKADNQSIIRKFYAGYAPIGKIARDMHAALDQSVRENFGGTVINCMGCASDNVFSRPESAVSRCSDDFLPDDAAWFTKHILQCAFTCMYQSPLVWSDWDMWWTNDGQALKNSVLRAISGGPVYISDPVGVSRKEIIEPLVSDDGRIFRCENPAFPAPDCLFGDPTRNGRIFKVCNSPGKCGAVAAFNLGEGEAAGFVSPRDVPGLSGEKFAVYEYFSGKTFVLEKDERIEITLKNKDEFALYIMSPVEDAFAAIGITSKFMSPLTVKNAGTGEEKVLADGEYLYFKDGAFYRENRRKNHE